MRLLLAFLFVSLSFLNVSATNIEACMCDRQSDSLELVKMYNEWDGVNWRFPWDLNQSIDNWERVNLGSDGCVASISLTDEAIVGELWNFNFSSINRLTIRSTNLRGNIPNFSKMPSLAHLNFHNCRLENSIPDFFNLENLTSLTLSENYLITSVPNFTNLEKLMFLDISRNQISEIPNFNNIPNLETFYCEYNQKIELPNFNFISNLKNLRVGPINTIPNFSNIPKLEELILYSDDSTNLIEVPLFTDINNLKNFGIFGYNITSPFPDFSTSPELEYLNISDCIIPFQLPTFSTLSKLRSLGITNNKCLDIPDFSGLDSLRSLRLNNSFHGSTIPDFDLPNLEQISLAQNLATGSVPTFKKCPKIWDLNLVTNNFNDTLPDYSHLTELKWLFALGANLIGKIPDFSKNTNLEILVLAQNKFIGGFPTNIPPDLRSFSVAENCLTGLVDLQTISTGTVGIMFNKFDSISPTSIRVNLIGNKFTFDDILPQLNNFNSTPDFNFYSPQQPKKANSYIRQEGNKQYLNLNFDSSIPDNSYKWYINGIFYDSTMVNEIEIAPSISETDSISVIVTNQRAYQLELEVVPFTISGMNNLWCIAPKNIVIDSIGDGAVNDWLNVFGGGELRESCPSISVSTEYSGNFECSDSTLVLFIANGCGRIDTASAYIYNLDNLSSITAKSLSLCFNQLPIEIDGQNFPDFGSYNFTFQNINGCDSIINYELIELPNYEDLNSEQICFGDSLEWQGYFLTQEGFYSDSLLTQNGCDSVLSLNLSFYDTPQLIDTTIINDDGTNSGSIALNFTDPSGYSFLWNTGDTTSSISNLEAGLYTLLLNYESNCQQTFIFQINGVSNTLENHYSELKIYPNPANNVLNVELKDVKLKWLRIVDITGREVLHKINLNGNVHLSIEQVKPGIYILKGKGLLEENYLSKFIKIRE